MKSQPVTIRDIAKKVGVSPSTVSRALKDHPEISQDTIDEVKKVAKELRYEPNPMALSFRNSRTNSIGVIVPQIVHFYFSTVISGMEEVAHSKGYHVLVTQSNESYTREQENCKALYDSRVDGYLICTSKETERFDHIHAIIDRGFPVVLFDRAIPELDCSLVTVEDETGGYIATKHLLSQGCKHVAFIGGPELLNNISAREKGYKRALEESGLKQESGLTIRVDYPIDSSEKIERLQSLLKTPGLDGIFVHNDMIAVEVLEMAKKSGKRVPEELKIIGFSNWQFTSFTTPKLSTIEQQGFDIGRKAAELLLTEIENNHKDGGFTESQNILLKPSLVMRESTGQTLL